jgi:uncharacterized membrane protein
MAEETNNAVQAETVPVQSDANDVQQNKVMAILAYVLFLIPLLAAKESKFAMYHANQGLILFIAGVIGSVVVGILTTISFGILGVCLGPLFTLAYFIFMILGIINAANGEMKPLPYIGNYTLLK